MANRGPVVESTSSQVVVTVFSLDKFSRSFNRKIDLSFDVLKRRIEGFTVVDSSHLNGPSRLSMIEDFKNGHTIHFKKNIAITIEPPEDFAYTETAEKNLMNRISKIFRSIIYDDDTFEIGISYKMSHKYDQKKDIYIILLEVVSTNSFIIKPSKK